LLFSAVYYRSVYVSIAERILYPKSALRFSQIRRGADNGFPDFADFDSAAGMVEKYTKRLPKFTKEWYKNFALHATLYVFMWLVPVAGFLLSNSIRNRNVPFFGIVVPDMFPKNPAMVEVGRSLHFWLSYTFLAFVILHILDQKKVVRANWRRLTNFVGTKFAKSQKVG